MSSRSGACARIRSSASAPSGAVTTSNPASATRRRRYSRMSALSSAIRTVARVAGLAAGGSTTSEMEPRAFSSASGNHWLSSSTNASARIAVLASVRAAPMRSCGRCRVPNGRVTLKRAALSERAAHLKRPAVQLQQFLRERQPDARAFMRASARAFHAVEAFEDARQLLLGDADAGVARLRASRRARPRVASAGSRRRRCT